MLVPEGLYTIRRVSNLKICKPNTFQNCNFIYYLIVQINQFQVKFVTYNEYTRW